MVCTLPATSHRVSISGKGKGVPARTHWYHITPPGLTAGQRGKCTSGEAPAVGVSPTPNPHGQASPNPRLPVAEDVTVWGVVSAVAAPAPQCRLCRACRYDLCQLGGG